MTYYPRAYLFLIAVPVFALIACFVLSRAIPTRVNPYSEALGYTTEEVQARANCYTESGFEAFDFGRYCILDSGHGHITFSFARAGDLSSVGFSRFADMQVGDIYALYGVPLSIRITKWYTNTTFANDEYRIMVSARENTLYSRVRFVWVSFR